MEQKYHNQQILPMNFSSFSRIFKHILTTACLHPQTFGVISSRMDVSIGVLQNVYLREEEEENQALKNEIQMNYGNIWLFINMLAARSESVFLLHSLTYFYTENVSQKVP